MLKPLFIKPGPLFERTMFLMLSLAGSLLLSVCPASHTAAQGNLMIMPRRVVFKGTTKLQELNLVNTGHDTARYVISLVHYRMKEDGSFEEMAATDTSGNFADKYVRFFPRSVVLGPNEAQSVRIQLRRSNNLLPGEYRSHLYFRAVPDERPLGDTAAGQPVSAGVSVSLVPIFGISIPVIIQVGEPATDVSIAASSLDKTEAGIPILQMTLNRKGNMSVYGNITVEHISPDGKTTRVGIVQGLAVYTPNPLRYVKMALDNSKGVDFSNGTLNIVYKAPEPGHAVLAQTQLTLNRDLIKSGNVQSHDNARGK
jgi:hypothetical protein